MEENRQKKDNRFLVGVFSGILITLMVIGLWALGKKFYVNYTYVKAIGEARQEGNTEVSGNEEILNTGFIKKIGIIENVIDEYFYDSYSTAEMENGVYSGMVEALGDKYSRYYSVEELEKLKEESSGFYSGIGAYITYDEENQICVIAGTMDGAPAEEAGLRAGDMIYKVDGVEVQGMGTSEVVSMIKGKEGTVVNLTIIREGADEFLEFEIERRKVETKSVVYEMKEDNIGYIGISEFDGATADQFTEALAVLKDGGARGIIIDLRGNLGGNLDAVCSVCRDILPEGLIVYTMDKYGKREEYTCDGSNELELPLIVLVNGYSASASEILTGAVKDYKSGTIMGTTTYGKGVVQKVIPLTDGSALKLTTSKYFTPKGVAIHGTGIEPDIEVDFDSVAYYEENVDNQLDAAIEEMHNIWSAN